MTAWNTDKWNTDPTTAFYSDMESIEDTVPVIPIKQTAQKTTPATDKYMNDTSEGVQRKISENVGIKSLIDAAILAARHAENCGVQARDAFATYTISLADNRQVCDETTKAYGIEARRAFDVYTAALATSLEQAATSDAAILQMTIDIEGRAESLAVGQ